MGIFRVIHRGLAIILFVMSIVSIVAGGVITFLFSQMLGIIPLLVSPLLYIEALATCCFDEVKNEVIIISNIFFKKNIKIIDIKYIAFSNWPLFKKNKIRIQGYHWYEYYIFYEDIDLIKRKIIDRFDMRKIDSLCYEHKYVFK